MELQDVTPAALTNMFANNADSLLVKTPEGELILAVIERTLDDARDAYDLHSRGVITGLLAQAEPVRSMLEGIVELYGAAIGLTPAFVRECLVKVYPWAFGVPEEWRDIHGYQGVYEVSDLGRVRSLDHSVRSAAYGIERMRVVKGSLLKPFVHAAGSRSQVCLGKRDKRYVEDLVIQAFTGPKPEGCKVEHAN